MTPEESAYWDLIHLERSRLADLLGGLTAEQWNVGSLCTEWTVEQVTAHLTAAANTGTWAWLRNMTLAGFNTDRHNSRLLNRYLGQSPAETSERFRSSVRNTIAPTKDHGAWLGEVIVHGQDIAQPLGVELIPAPAAVQAAAGYLAGKDFAVNSHSLVKGLTLRATDADFRSGDGPLVQGRLLDLVMVMAGRPSRCELLEGEGVAELRRRLA